LPVRCERPEFALHNHTGYELRDTDRHDIALLREHLGPHTPDPPKQRAPASSPSARRASTLCTRSVRYGARDANPVHKVGALRAVRDGRRTSS
jgi:hypothetical protein